MWGWSNRRSMRPTKVLQMLREGIEFWFVSRCLVDIREGRNCSQYLTNCYLNCHVDIQPHRTQTLKGT